ncbi:MAG: adenosylmethionine--8-amino-7-oxononanoate transaminase [Gammaproteobacteria bacterium]|nr:MAG: adenosylmethionine--8-amino-7-oxononanoate transaminase [Gammaproteobacteria bacterium]TDJ44781.1 MAG: adenosylmethionine--8-amino-7-oxononanoate transaminase [Gammaproteobacteria bacterium]
MTSSHLWLPYSQMQTVPAPQMVTRTEGVRIYLADGRCLIDGTSSWWTACHGYNHPHIAAAVAAQLEQLPHVMLGGLVHKPVLDLSRRLAGLLPGDLDYVFFSESGSVSVEIALKMAVQFWINQGVQARSRFLSFQHAYHGDTFAAMSVCDPDKGMHRLLSGVLAQQLVVKLPRGAAEFTEFEQVVAKHAAELAAVIIEPLVQAAAGMKFHQPEVLAKITEIAARYDLLVIFDEITTGFGRTGTMFACEQAGVVPDIMTLSKALTGGTVPLAATIARRHVYESFLSDSIDQALVHGPTFCGNPMGCAAANASLDLFESEPRLEQVAAIEAGFEAGLAPCRGLAQVRDVRVKGAIGVVQLDRVPDLDALRQRFLEAGVWVRPFADVIYLMPPLVIGAEELDTLIQAVNRVVKDWSALPS